MDSVDTGRILLIHPLGYDPQHAEADISRMANLMPPLGLALLAAFIEQEGFTADIIDCFAVGDADSRIDDYVRRHRPGFVGLSCTTHGFLDAARIAKRIKDMSSDCLTIVGGPHVSALREGVLDGYDGIDFAVIGEGERPLLGLMKSGGRSLAEIPGLVYRQAGEIRFSGLQDKGICMDDLPLPAYEKLEGFPASYQLPVFNYPKAPNTSCISSRGCPYQCSYCDRSVFRRTFRYNSADYLYAHLEHLRGRFNIRHVNFYDDNFTFHRGRIEEFCNQMIARPLGMTFNCAARSEHLDKPLVKLMKRAGCWMISLGIETGDPDLLVQHRQNADLDLLAEKIRDIHAVGIRVKGLLMLGLPGESHESFQRTMDYVFSLPIDDVNLSRFTPFPGSPIYERIHELGEFNDDWASMDCINTVFVPHGLSRKELDEMFTLFYKTHFTRLRVLWSYVTFLWKSPDSWRRFLRNIGGFLRFAISNQRLGKGSATND